jgi:hypothetical protein
VLRTYEPAPQGLYLTHAYRLIRDLVDFFRTTEMAAMGLSPS